MSIAFFHPTQVLRLVIVWLTVWFLFACGGGISVSGVGSGGSGIAEGSVTGFGSVIVNGVEYDDSSAVSQSEDATGTQILSAAKLGQQVRISQSKDGVAETIDILPQLRGPVTRLDAGSAYLQVMGQWVRVVSVSNTAGTATVLDGYDAIGSIAQGDALEVHGVWSQDASKGLPVLVASRIEKVSGSYALLISGQVTSVTGLGLLTLNGSATVLETDPSLAFTVGTQVTAWLSQWANPPQTLRVTRIKDAAPVPAGAQLLRLEVMAAASDLSNGQLRAQGRLITIPANLQGQLPANPAPLLLEATLQNLVWTATALRIRGTPQDLGGEIVLKGAVPWDATAQSLTLREATVRIVGSTVISPNCPRSGPMVALEVHALRGPPGSTPVATTINCFSTVPDAMVIRQGGYLQSIASDGNSVTVLFDGQSSPTTLVLFGGSLLPPPPNDLNALRSGHIHVDVEYQVIAAQNQLRKVTPPPPQSGP